MRHKDGSPMTVEFSAYGDVKVVEGGVEPEADSAIPSRWVSSRQDLRALVDDEAEPITCWAHYSLFLFSPSNPIRWFCDDVVHSQPFERLILFLIAVSSIMLAVDEPRIESCKDLPSSDPSSCRTLSNTLQWMDIIITALFGVEMILKIIAMGFVINSKAYLKSSWNQLDFAIVAISIASLIASGSGSGQLKALRSLRALRALRPLRVVARNPGLRIVVNSIFGSLPKVSNVALVNFLFFLVFAVIGV